MHATPMASSARLSTCKRLTTAVDFWIDVVASCAMALCLGKGFVFLAPYSSPSYPQALFSFKSVSVSVAMPASATRALRVVLAHSCRYHGSQRQHRVALHQLRHQRRGLAP